MTAIDNAEDYPIVALSLQTSGIHPASAHIVRIDALTATAEGDVGHHYHWLINPVDNPGPIHLHGASRADLSQAPRFSSVLKQLDSLIDGRTLIVHNAARTWGFLVADSRRAMNYVARMNRNRNKGRRRSVGRVPEPVAIVDTLASWRRSGRFGNDTRIHAVGIDLACPSALDPTASVARADADTTAVAQAETAVLLEIYQRLHPTLVSIDPATLTADPFGLQRDTARVEAMLQTPEYPNPGRYDPQRGLVYGMEFVVAPEITADPLELITKGSAANLTYSEKMTRTASVLVCNKTSDFVGKGMHADRKNIPIISDDEFLAAVEQVRPPTAAEIAAAPDIPRIPRLRAAKSVLKNPSKATATRRATGTRIGAGVAKSANTQDAGKAGPNNANASKNAAKNDAKNDAKPAKKRNRPNQRRRKTRQGQTPTENQPTSRTHASTGGEQQGGTKSNAENRDNTGKSPQRGTPRRRRRHRSHPRNA
ncbi:MAG: exonuclease domain-containing protein [Corynebacterium sp.]|nr:exonuclease domain-containing protein [Corynebacterium sp.]